MILSVAHSGRAGYAHLMSEDDDVATLKDESPLYRIIDDITRSANMNFFRTGALLSYTNFGSGSSIGINQFEAGKRFENHPNWYAGTESALYMTNTLGLLQLRNLKTLQNITENFGLEDAPEYVKTATTYLLAGFAGHFLMFG